MTGRAPSSRPTTPYGSAMSSMRRSTASTRGPARSPDPSSSAAHRKALVATPSGMWAAARAFTAASHRGGTLTVVGDDLPGVDPVRAYDPTWIPALATVYDGLVALRRSGGAAGHTLIPDLACDAAAPGQRRHHVYVHASPGHPLLQRHARAGVRLPPRYPAPAQLRRQSRLLRRHPRRANVPPAPAAMRPVRRDHHRRRGPDGHLPPSPG